jgi:glycine cleavage system H protein
VSETSIPADLAYTEEDEWVRREDERVVIGITDYAQQQLGDVVHIVFPEVGAPLTKGAAFGEIESVKAVVDLYAPLSGTVSAVNDDLDGNFEKVNEDPYADGWLIAIEPGQPGELDTLMDAAAYAKHVAEREK